MSWWIIGSDPKNKLPAMPRYPTIDLSHIPPASIALYYNVNAMTEKEARVKGFPYKMPPAHASVVLESGKHLNQGATAQIKNLSDELRSTRRVDIITFPIPDFTRSRICDAARCRIGEPYDVLGFLAFGFRFFHPAGWANFCSEQVVELFGSEGIKVSTKPASGSEPFRLWDYWHIHNVAAQTQMFTLYIGDDYPREYYS